MKPPNLRICELLVTLLSAKLMNYFILSFVTDIISGENLEEKERKTTSIG